MKMFRRLVLMVFCSVGIASCFDPPEYPDTPEIIFKSVNFVAVPDLPTGEVTPDSLILVLRFKDGDGNLGLSPNETAPPFNDRWYYLKTPVDPKVLPQCAPYANENRCFDFDLSQIDHYINYTDRSTPPYDTLKDFVKPYNCTNWDVVRDEQGKVVNQIYFSLNPHYSNIFVEFQTKTGTVNDPDPYVPFNWSDFLTYPSCEVQGFNGRFPLLQEPGTDSSPLEGEIRYSMPSPFFKIIFGSKTIRLKVYIEDRALNKSNVIYTNDFNF
jgi:hypothetical protein